MVLAGLLFLLLQSQPVSAKAETPRRCNASQLMLQVLGSGGPFASGNRASSGYLVWRDGKPIVMVDAGGGTYLRFAEAGATEERKQREAAMKSRPFRDTALAERKTFPFEGRVFSNKDVKAKDSKGGTP